MFIVFGCVGVSVAYKYKLCTTSHRIENGNCIQPDSPFLFPYAEYILVHSVNCVEMDTVDSAYWLLFQYIKYESGHLPQANEQ